MDWGRLSVLSTTGLLLSIQIGLVPSSGEGIPKNCIPVGSVLLTGSLNVAYQPSNITRLTAPLSFAINGIIFDSCFLSRFWHYIIHKNHV